MKIGKITLLIGLLISITSCANYQPNYSKKVHDWESQSLPADLKVTHSMFLAGDAGGVASGLEGPALKLLNKKLQQAGKESSVVYLGDNIYPNGLAPKSEKEERAEDEYRLLAQLKALEGFEGRSFFLPGNHDWYRHGLKGVKRQKNFVEDYLDDKDVFFPDPGCGGPEEIKLSKNLTLIIIDSEWYLKDWEGESEINDGCEAKSRQVFKVLFEEAIKGNRSKNIVVALHHSPYTKGPHGGQYPLKEHLFPLTALNKDLWIPLPGLGSVFQFLRATVGSRQDLANPRYRELRDLMVEAARKNGNFIFVSGHDHSLQYAEDEGQAFIVSGAGSKYTATKTGAETQFAYGHRGFAQLNFYEDGSAWVQYWVPNEDGSEGREVFRKQVSGPLERIIENTPSSFPPMPEYVEVPISQEDFSRSKTGEKIWGAHYRKAYNTVLKVPALDLSKFKGGVRPLKKGGGYQTNSLRLENGEGRQYTLRSLDKDATRTVPYTFSRSFVVNVLKDVFSAAHPLSALPIPVLADAAGVHHTNPQLVYVPRQKNLGRFNDDFGNALYLVEERPDDDKWKDAAFFGYPDEVVGTPDVLEEITDNHDHLIDYNMVVRSRLFDIFLGDWDRHDDQWRWAQIEKEGRKYYQPIPRDRDQAMSHYDGAILGLGRLTIPYGKQLRKFEEEIKPDNYFSYNARHFDKTFLAGLEWRDWVKAVNHLQATLTDEVIESAFKKTWPTAIYDLNGEHMVRSLKKRRDDLMRYARNHYLQLAEKVDIVGTNQRDLFTVERLDDQRLRVRIYDTNKEGDREDLLFERTFLALETKELAIYGLGDEDIFKVLGNTQSSILVRMVGGADEDIFEDQSKVSGSGGKRTIIYDASDGNNTINKGKEAKVKLSQDPVLNTYDRKSQDYEYNYTFFLPSLGFNPDDGLLLGAFGQIVNYGFKKAPYATSHSFNLNYALRTSGFGIGYSGEVIDAMGKWDILIDGRYQTPLYTTNFYGFGNETINPETDDDEEFEFNQVRQRIVSFAPSLMRKFNTTSRLYFGPSYEAIRIDRTEGRFIDVEGDNLNPDIFDGLEFFGLRMAMEYENKNNAAFPSRGLGFRSELGWKTQLEDQEKNFAFIKASLSVYQRIDPKGKAVLATRVGVHHNFNENYEFYQGATLGGIGPNSNMRGLRRDRFNGQTVFYQNFDLRLRLLQSSNKVLPFTLGLIGGFDYGRVWLSGEDSDTWHTAFGGGIWFSPFDMFAINLGVFNGGDDRNVFTFGGAFFF